MTVTVKIPVQAFNSKLMSKMLCIFITVPQDCFVIFDSNGSPDRSIKSCNEDCHSSPQPPVIPPTPSPPTTTQPGTKASYNQSFTINIYRSNIINSNGRGPIIILLHYLIIMLVCIMSAYFFFLFSSCYN